MEGEPPGFGSLLFAEQISGGEGGRTACEIRH